jgi:HSP20 family protein
MRMLAPWRPATSLSTLHNEMDSLFARLLGDEERWWARPLETEMMPAVESFVRGEELVVRADLPGIDPKNVELAVEGDRLTIKGERKAVEEGKRGERLHREVSYGRFERIMVLPGGVDADSVKATYHDGVLEVTMKLPKGMTAKKVPITVH